jgi:hypothetical protein
MQDAPSGPRYPLVAQARFWPPAAGEEDIACMSCPSPKNRPKALLALKKL